LEESSSEDETQQAGLPHDIPPSQVLTPSKLFCEESEADSNSGSGTIIASELPQKDYEMTAIHDRNLDPKEKKQVHCWNVTEMLKALRDGKPPQDDSGETATDHALNQLNYKRFFALKSIGIFEGKEQGQKN